MNAAQFIEKNVIAELIKMGFEPDTANMAARQAVTHYHRSGSASGKSKAFDDCLNIGKAWAHKYQPKKKK